MEDILYAIITAVLPIVLRFVWQLVSAKIGESKYASAVDAVFSAVEYVNQTFVDSLKQSGSFDDEAKQRAFEMAKDAALETMQKGTKKWLEKTYVNLDAWFEVQIEGAVKETK